MDLVIVESPTKARTLSRFLPSKEYEVIATVGHIRDLPKSKMGVEPEKDFEVDWAMVKGKRELMRKIRQAGLKAKRIILATDPDREGEAISWHVYDLLKKNTKFPLDKKIVKRATFHEITKSAVEEAIANAHEINESLVDAQAARRVVDRLVGYQLSPVLWKKVRRGLSAGRVQSVAVRLVVEREREREAFVAVEFWEVYSEVSSQKSVVDKQQTDQIPDKNRRSSSSFRDDSWGVADKDVKDAFMIKLAKKNGKKLDVGNEQEADGVLADLSVADYVVAEVKKKDSTNRPSPPFTTSTLQQTAGQKMGYSAKFTMSTAQKLYEQGLITYHRTDAFNLSKEAVASVRAFVDSTYGKQYVPEKPMFYATKSKSAQEAHEAIRPTNVTKTPSDAGLSGSEKKLYELIWKRFVACQMNPALYDKTDITVNATADDAGSVVYQLEISGRILKFDGFLKVWGVPKQDDLLPDVSVGQSLGLLQVWGNQRFTDPPARYSEATLIKALELQGIGRPSTYASILSTIQDRNYVENEDKRLKPTAIGLAVNDFLVQNFPNELDYQFTARMEDSLDDIANGSKQWKAVLREFYDPFKKHVGEAEGSDRIQIPVETTGEPCPDCVERRAYVEGGGADLENFMTTKEKEELEKQKKKAAKAKEENGKKPTKRKDDEPTTATNGELVVRTGRFGKFLSCSEFPHCRYMGKYEEKIDMVCPECGEKEHGEVIVKSTRKGRTFYACNRYPACKWANWKDPRDPASESVSES